MSIVIDLEERRKRKETLKNDVFLEIESLLEEFFSLCEQAEVDFFIMLDREMPLEISKIKQSSSLYLKFFHLIHHLCPEEEVLDDFSRNHIADVLLAL